MHQHHIEDENGELVDVAVFCSDPCHLDYCHENDLEYGGWNGCIETESTRYCEQCGVVLPGFDACEHQTGNIVVNRFLVEENEDCECGNTIQIGMKHPGTRGR